MVEIIKKLFGLNRIKLTEEELRFIKDCNFSDEEYKAFETIAPNAMLYNVYVSSKDKWAMVASVRTSEECH